MQATTPLLEMVVAKCVASYETGRSHAGSQTPSRPTDQPAAPAAVALPPGREANPLAKRETPKAISNVTLDFVEKLGSIVELNQAALSCLLKSIKNPCCYERYLIVRRKSPKQASIFERRGLRRRGKKYIIRLSLSLQVD